MVYNCTFTRFETFIKNFTIHGVYFNMEVYISSVSINLVPFSNNMPRQTFADGCKLLLVVVLSSVSLVCVYLLNIRLTRPLVLVSFDLYWNEICS